jgi:hypothetical protein
VPVAVSVEESKYKKQLKLKTDKKSHPDLRFWYEAFGEKALP